jgi:hypothetical protein
VVGGDHQRLGEPERSPLVVPEAGRTASAGKACKTSLAFAELERLARVTNQAFGRAGQLSGPHLDELPQPRLRPEGVVEADHRSVGVRRERLEVQAVRAKARVRFVVCEPALFVLLRLEQVVPLCGLEVTAGLFKKLSESPLELLRAGRVDDPGIRSPSELGQQAFQVPLA